jgi:hypothetical protein
VIGSSPASFSSRASGRARLLRPVL